MFCSVVCCLCTVDHRCCSLSMHNVCSRPQRCALGIYVLTCGWGEVRFFLGWEWSQVSFLIFILQLWNCHHQPSVNPQIHTHTHTQHTLTCTHAHTRTRTHAHAHAHTYIYTHTHTHTHTHTLIIVVCCCWLSLGSWLNPNLWVLQARKTEQHPQTATITCQRSHSACQEEQLWRAGERHWTEGTPLRSTNP